SGAPGPGEPQAGQRRTEHRTTEPRPRPPAMISLASSLLSHSHGLNFPARQATVLGCSRGPRNCHAIATPRSFQVMGIFTYPFSVQLHNRMFPLSARNANIPPRLLAGCSRLTDDIYKRLAISPLTESGRKGNPHKEES